MGEKANIRNEQYRGTSTPPKARTIKSNRGDWSRVEVQKNDWIKREADRPWDLVQTSYTGYQWEGRGRCPVKADFVIFRNGSWEEGRGLVTRIKEPWLEL